MAFPLAIMGGMAAAGALSSYMNAKKANEPTWQQTNPWDSGAADKWKGLMGGHLDNMQGLDYGPTAAQNWMFGNMGNSAFGGGGGGGMNMDWQGRNVGRYNVGKIDQRTRGIGSAQTDWEKRVTDESFMDMENDPYVQQRLDAMTQESNEQMARAQAESIGPESMGGTMGMSGAQMATRGGIADDYSENANAQRAGFLNDQMGMRFGLGDSANAQHSGREGARDNALIGADASGYGSYAQAQTAMRGQDMEGAYRQGMLGQMGADRKWNQQMDMWGMGEQMRQMGLQGQGLGAYGMTADYGQQMLPYQQGFGRTYNQGPQVSPLGAGIQGAMSGAATGMGMGKSLQGMGFFGGGGGGGLPSGAQGQGWGMYQNPQYPSYQGPYG